jgi:hypothetical protein
VVERLSGAGFDLSLTWGRWLGLYPTVEGIAAQIAALIIVYGAYALARGVQHRRRRRALAGPELTTRPV